MDKVNMSLDDLIKVGRKETKAKAAKKAPAVGKKDGKVTGKAAAKIKVTSKGTAAKKTKKGGKSMDVDSQPSKNVAKATGKAKAQRNAAVANKRGIAPVVAGVSQKQINAAIQKEAKKIAQKMMADSMIKSKTGVKAPKGAKNNGMKGGKSLQISFKPADLGRTTASNVSKQLRGVLTKAPKNKIPSTKASTHNPRRVVLK